MVLLYIYIYIIYKYIDISIGHDFNFGGLLLSYSFVTMMGWSSWGNWAATLLAFVSLKNDGYVLEDYSNIHQFIVKTHLNFI